MIRLTPKQFAGIRKPAKAARVKQPAKRSAPPKLLESAVSKQINGLLAAHGWECHRTPSDKMQTAAGHWVRIYPEGHADWLCTRPVESGTVDMFYREDKGERARTAKDRKAMQLAWAEQMSHRGYLVWTCPENCADPYGEFTKWYRDNWE